MVKDALPGSGVGSAVVRFHGAMSSRYKQPAGGRACGKTSSDSDSAERTPPV